MIYLFLNHIDNRQKKQHGSTKASDQGRQFVFLVKYHTKVLPLDENSEDRSYIKTRIHNNQQTVTEDISAIACMILVT